MATAVTGSTIVLPVITKVENQDIHAKNWATEVVKLVFGTNTATAYTLNTSTTTWPAATTATGPMHISTPIFVTVDGGGDDASHVAPGFGVAYTDGQVVITWIAAPVDCTLRVKIEGWA